MRKSTDFWLIIFIIFLMFFPRIAGYLLVSNSIKNDKSHKIEERIFKEFEKEFDNKNVEFVCLQWLI